jgi:glycosyltransferase involved in cell wall biosynthesis
MTRDGSCDEAIFEMRIGILHYSAWPVIGGVETVIRQHAQLLSRHGHEVSIFSGEGAAFSKQVPSIVFRELNTRDSLVKAAQQEAFSGHPGRAYFELFERLQGLLRPLFTNFERLIVHNILTMQFNMAATQALTTFADQGKRMIAWTHDLAASNSDYQIPLHQPFDLLRERHVNVKYVAISKARATEFNRLTGAPVSAIIPNALDFIDACGITPEVAQLVTGELTDSILLFYPTRILERKNIAFALQIVAALAAIGARVRLLISGANDPHNSAGNAYFAGLKKLAKDLQVHESVFWVNDLFYVDERQLRSLYMVADALLFPSKQEGFGLPLLEATAYRLPIFCANTEPLKSIAPRGTVLFDLRDAPRNIAERIRSALTQNEILRSRKQLFRDYSAETLYVDKVEPLLQDKL